MIKTRLFVRESSEAMPKSISEGFPEKYLGDSEAWVRESLMPTAIRARSAHQWWLVYCMDASHGRSIISHAEKHGEDAMLPDIVGGRILASGGKR